MSDSHSIAPNTASAETAGPLKTADGKPLKVALARAQARSRRRAFLLVAPLLLFVVITFVVPIFQLLAQSVNDPSFSRAAPNMVEWFAQNPDAEPDEAAYAALVADLVEMKKNRTAADAGTRINYELSGSRSLFTSAARSADRMEAPFMEAMLDKDEKWGDPMLWQVMRGASTGFTINFYLAALDMTRDAEGNIIAAPEDRQIYVKLFIRTFVLSALIMLTTFILGFPVAHLLAVLPMRTSNLLMILVLLPFWTSLLVRTTAWIALLQREGVINSLLVSVGVIGEDGRLSMIYNQAGTVIAMTHILLPFMILPLYSVMRPIPPSYVRAARSLGATSFTAFWRVYFPQTVPGIAAGGLLVFILAVGYYITPALVGGASGQLISNLIAFHMNDSYNWSLASALAALLLFAVLVLYWLYDRMIGIDRMKLG